MFLATGIAGGVPPFEHVAIVLNARSVDSVVEIADVGTYSLPESIADGFSPGLWETTARVAWLNHPAVQSRQLGDSMTGWNAGWRVDLTPNHRRYLRSRGKIILGSFRYEYTPDARIKTRPPNSDNLFAVVFTNCVGFVRWMYREAAKVELVVDDFPAYGTPFASGGVREYASPGHLARAADLPLGMLPYAPANQAQAENDALVVK